MRQTVDQTGVGIDNKRKHGRQPAQRSGIRVAKPDRLIEVDDFIILAADISRSKFSPSGVWKTLVSESGYGR